MIVKNMIKKGMSDQLIADIASLDIEEVKEVRQRLNGTNES